MVTIALIRVLLTVILVVNQRQNNKFQFEFAKSHLLCFHSANAMQLGIDIVHCAFNYTYFNNDN